MWAFFKVTFLPPRSPWPDISSNSRCGALSRAPYTKSGTHSMCLVKSPHGHRKGPPLLPSSDVKRADSKRCTSQKDGWPCSRMSMRTVPSDARRRPLYLNGRVFPKPCHWGGAPCIAYETNFKLPGLQLMLPVELASGPSSNAPRLGRLIVPVGGRVLCTLAGYVLGGHHSNTGAQPLVLGAI